MKIMRAEVWAAIVILLISFVFLYQSFSYSYSSELGPGPGYFPVWLSGILLILSCLYIFESLTAESGSAETMPRGEALRKILFILGCLSLFLILISIIGFVLTGTIFLFLLLFREYKWYSNLGISLGVSIFLFWLFDIILGVTLPVNGLGW